MTQNIGLGLMETQFSMQKNWFMANF